MRGRSEAAVLTGAVWLAFAAMACATSVATVDNGDGGAGSDGGTDATADEGVGYDASRDTTLPHDSALFDGGPGLDSTFPGIDSGLPGVDSGLPGFDSGIPSFDSSFPGFDGAIPAVCDPTMAKYIAECLGVSNPTECAPNCPTGQCCDLFCLDSNGAPLCLPQ